MTILDKTLIEDIIWYDYDNKNRRRTNFLNINTEGNLCYVTAVCSLGDRFIRKRGRDICAGRMSLLLTNNNSSDLSVNPILETEHSIMFLTSPLWDSGILGRADWRKEEMLLDFFEGYIDSPFYEGPDLDESCMHYLPKMARLAIQRFSDNIVQNLYGSIAMNQMDSPISLRSTAAPHYFNLIE